MGHGKVISSCKEVIYKTGEFITFTVQISGGKTNALVEEMKIREKPETNNCILMLSGKMNRALAMWALQGRLHK